MKTALVIIDVQSYFMQGSPADLPARIAEHVKNTPYDHIIYTVFRNVPDSNYVKSLNWTKCSDDEDLVVPPELEAVLKNAQRVDKTTYSMFKVPGVHEKLQELDIDRLEICGMDTEACVLATAFEGFDLGYKVMILFELAHSRNGQQDDVKKLAARNLTAVPEAA